MFRYKGNIFKENKMPISKIKCYLKTVICTVLRSVAASFKTVKVFKTYM